ncbi:MAG: hypothetical protein UH542_09630 [Bacteroidales bacterium]|nr:hypothetical protein [Bacteroidales bacterium]
MRNALELLSERGVEEVIQELFAGTDIDISQKRNLEFFYLRKDGKEEKSSRTLNNTYNTLKDMCTMVSMLSGNFGRTYYVRDKNISSDNIIFVAMPCVIANKYRSLDFDDLQKYYTHIHRFGNLETLTLLELSRIFRRSSAWKGEKRYPVERLDGNLCSCEEYKGDFDLLPPSHPKVKEAGKRLIVCRNCGCIARL